MDSQADNTRQADEIPPKEQPDTGLMGLALLAQFHGVFVDIPQLIHQYGEGLAISTKPHYCFVPSPST
ncbi:Uncharacterised protein [Serratia fonticola]|uniref:Uncharacterized protein n=1 Tax=Serratia fonticola TaxID=47917 RepID=A0A4U9VZA0_SERFO|nr:Uncharacterised protein [Serratia fonticola]